MKDVALLTYGILFIGNIFKLNPHNIAMKFFAEQAHSSVERAGLLGGVKLRTLKPDNKRRLRGDTLKEAIEEDKRNGLIPFYVSIIILYLILKIFQPYKIYIKILCTPIINKCESFLMKNFVAMKLCKV